MSPISRRPETQQGHAGAGEPDALFAALSDDELETFVDVLHATQAGRVADAEAMLETCDEETCARFVAIITQYTVEGAH